MIVVAREQTLQFTIFGRIIWDIQALGPDTFSAYARLNAGARTLLRGLESSPKVSPPVDDRHRPLP